MTDVLSERDAKIRALIEQDTLLKELVQHPGWAVFTGIANVSLDAYQQRLNSGRLDVDQYRFIAGWLDGARSLLGVPEAVDQRLAHATAQATEPDDVASVIGEAYAPPVTD